ncbi:Hydrocephalus-inducing protein-like [Durusdinium trenchii]|uniref:Hydrocephalus-inducing protein-like n=1 Tax=Durusdinium trenchii TaxID=1381693 RepID=A0ABP0REV0_9DINO
MEGLTLGVLAVGEEKLISVIFKSETACVHKFKLTLQISDVEGLRSWENAAELNVQAEAFVVDVVPQFPEEATGLDFGDVRVGELVEKSFQVANNGKYPVKFQLHIRRKSVRELVQIDYGVPLEEPQMSVSEKPAFQQVQVQNCTIIQDCGHVKLKSLSHSELPMCNFMCNIEQCISPRGNKDRLDRTSQGKTTNYIL